MTMTTPEMLLAVLALLMTPGPTNTLMALSGAERGWRRALRLIPAELAGYLSAILPLVLAGPALLAVVPGLDVAITLTAAGWVLALGLRLWRVPPATAPSGGVTPGAVYVTTLLNPKGLIFGLVLLPAPDLPALGLNLALFCGAVCGVAALWAGAGAALRGTGPQPGAGQRSGHYPVLRRAAGLWLMVVALWLAVRGAELVA